MSNRLCIPGSSVLLSSAKNFNLLPHFILSQSDIEFFFTVYWTQNNSLTGVSKSLSHSPQRRVQYPVLVAAVSSNGRSGERNVTLLMENTLKEMRDGSAAVEPKSTVGGGVEDVYGEDQATEDQPVTPWTVSVARSVRDRWFLSFLVIVFFF